MNDLKLNHKKVYRHKLNLLEPGIIMSKVILALTAAGVVFWALECNKIAIVLLALAGITFAILMVLVVIEAYQDERLNEFFICTNDDTEEIY